MKDLNLKKRIDKFQTKLVRVKNNLDNLKPEELSLLSDYYDDLALAILNSNEAPETVKDVIVNEDKDTFDLPSEYNVLNDYKKLKVILSNDFNKKANQLVKNNPLSETINKMVIMSKFDFKNTEKITLFENKIKNKNLTQVLINIYKDLFPKTSDISYLERMGDLYYKQKSYENALESYLNYAEVCTPNAKIYKKLAKVFEMLNDTESQNMCLKQATMLENEHEQS